MTVDQHNKKVWSETDIADEYAVCSGLTTAENFILDRFASEISGRSILDIGVGVGRTTRSLIAMSENYVGIDYSREMIEKCRSKFIGVDIIECDAHDLSPLKKKQFGFVFFSYNGIDYVAHEGRTRILQQIYNSLTPDGILVFSSHNLEDLSVVSAYSYKNIHLSFNMLVVLKCIYSYAAGIRNHLSCRRAEVRTKDYVIINDSASNYRFLTYYVSKKFQVEALQSIGFSNVELVNYWGSQIHVEAENCGPWIHYIARKQGDQILLE